MINVVFGFIGSTLDKKGSGPHRWDTWRPTIDLVRHEDFVVDRLEIFHQRRDIKLTRAIVEDVACISPETEVVLHEMHITKPWDFEEVYAVLHDFCIQYTFEPENENYYVHITTGTHVAQICTFLLTETRHFPASLVQTGPPRGKEKGGVGSISFIDLDLSKYDKLASRFNQEKLESYSFLKSGIETKNKPFNELIKQIEVVAMRSKEPILIMGPTGAGKSQLASRIYELKRIKRQVQGNFVELNCATLKGDAAMSALFGHVKGAFTGAQNQRDGLLIAAHDGVLFLDEIAELGLDEQTMLLRALEEKRFLPLGSDHEKCSDFQLIAGTNQNLFERVEKGLFREDLFARINLWTFELPGLKQRPEDILPNIEYELDRFTQQNGTRVTFNKEALNTYLNFAISKGAQWKANFRDLRASITRMSTLSGGERISTRQVQQEIGRLKRFWGHHPTLVDSCIKLENFIEPDLLEMMDLFEQMQLKNIIEICLKSDSMAHAGRLLFDKSRVQKSTSNDSDRVRKYLNKYGLNWKKIQNAYQADI
jgi:transcriptional regulatory protein RtcR